MKKTESYKSLRKGVKILVYESVGAFFAFSKLRYAEIFSWKLLERSIQDFENFKRFVICVRKNVLAVPCSQ